MRVYAPMYLCEQIIEHEGAVPDFWCPPSKFSALGTGITLYFNSLGTLMRIFSVVGLIAIALCLVHIAVALMPSTQGLEDRSQDLLGLTRLAIPTLATELMALPPPATVLESVFNGGADIRTVNLFFSVSDVVLLTILLVYVLTSQAMMRREAHRADQDVCSITDYSLMVHGLPKDATARELMHHLEECAPGVSVAEIVLLKPCGEVFKLNRKKKAKEGRLRRNIDAGSSQARISRRSQQVSNTLGAMEALALEASKNATKAFVVFTNEADVYTVLRLFPRSQILRFMQKRSTRLRGTHCISVEHAPDPSNIIWENLEYDLMARAVRKGIVMLMLFALLLCSAAFIFYARSKEPPASLDCAASEELGFLRCNDVYQIDVLTDRANTTFAQRALLQSYWAGSGASKMLNNCLEDERYIGFRNGQNVWRPGPYSLPDANISSLAPYVPITDFAPFSIADNCSAVACYSCYCERIGFQDYFNDKDGHKGFCEDYWSVIGIKALIRLGIVLSIVIIDGAMGALLRRISSFEKAHTVSKMEATLSIKLAIAQFINICLVTLAVYAYIEDFKGLYDDLGLPTFEWATDFSYRWYQQVGTSITLTLIVSAVLKPLQGYMNHYWSWCVRNAKLSRKKVPVTDVNGNASSSSSGGGTNIATRFVVKTVLKTNSKMSQNDVDKLFIGPRFILSERYGEILSMWLACLLFSSGMPLLYFVFGFYISLQALMDRILLLRVCRRPAQYDEKLGLQFLKYLPVGLLFKTAFGFWMFSGRLASYTLGDHLTGYVNVTKGTSDDFEDRVLKVNGFIQLVAFLIVLLSMLIKLNWGFIKSLFVMCCGPNNMCFRIDDDYEGNPPFHVAKGMDVASLTSSPTHKHTHTHSLTHTLSYYYCVSVHVCTWY